MWFLNKWSSFRYLCYSFLLFLSIWMSVESAPIDINLNHQLISPSETVKPTVGKAMEPVVLELHYDNGLIKALGPQLQPMIAFNNGQGLKIMFGNSMGTKLLGQNVVQSVFKLGLVSAVQESGSETTGKVEDGVDRTDGGNSPGFLYHYAPFQWVLDFWNTLIALNKGKANIDPKARAMFEKAKQSQMYLILTGDGTGAGNRKMLCLDMVKNLAQKHVLDVKPVEQQKHNKPWLSVSPVGKFRILGEINIANIGLLQKGPRMWGDCGTVQNNEVFMKKIDYLIQMRNSAAAIGNQLNQGANKVGSSTFVVNPLNAGELKKTHQTSIIAGGSSAGANQNGADRKRKLLDLNQPNQQQRTNAIAQRLRAAVVDAGILQQQQKRQKTQSGYNWENGQNQNSPIDTKNNNAAGGVEHGGGVGFPAHLHSDQQSTNILNGMTGHASNSSPKIISFQGKDKKYVN